MNHSKGRTSRTRKLRKKYSDRRALACSDDPDLVQLCQWMTRTTITDGRHRCCMTAGTVAQVADEATNKSKNSKSYSEAVRYSFRRVNKGYRFVEFPDTGRGLMTLTNIGTGSVIMSIPRKLMITCNDVVKIKDIKVAVESFNEKLTVNELLATFILYSKGLAKQSFWYPYIYTLPNEFLTITDFNDAQYYPYYIRKKLQDHFELLQTASRKLQSLFLQPTLSRFNVSNEDVFWAYMAVNSRCVYLKEEEAPSCLIPTEPNDSALAPYLDLLNHSFSASVVVGLDPSSQCYKITTNVPFKKHEQVFINYGAHDNVTLFIEYGFILPSNPHDNYPITADNVCAAIDKCGEAIANYKDITRCMYEKKQTVLSSIHGNVFLARDGPSWSLEIMTAVLLLRPEDITTWSNIYNSDITAVPHYPSVVCIILTLIQLAKNTLEGCIMRITAETCKSKHLYMGLQLLKEQLAMIEACHIYYSELHKK